MQSLFEVLLVLAALWFIWRVVRLIGRFNPMPEPPDPVGSRELVPTRPRTNSGAVALDEPDEPDEL